MARRRTSHILRTTFYPATHAGPARIKVLDMMSEVSKTFPASTKSADPHVDAVLKFTGSQGASRRRGTRTGRGGIYHAWNIVN